MLLVYMIVGWIIGIACAAWLPSLAPMWIGFLIGGALLTALSFRNVQWRQYTLLLACIGLGILRYSTAQPTFTENDLATYNDKGYLEMTGLVIDAPDVRDNNVHLKVEVQSIRQYKQQDQPVHGVALVDAQRFGGYAYGDKLLIQASPVTPPTFDTFSYRDYLARSGIHTFIPYGKVEILARGQGNSLQAALFDVRDKSHQLINQLLPSPQSALLSGILLGDASDMPPDVSTAFDQTGTTHIIAISGSNITIVAGLLLAILSHLHNKRLSVILMLVGITVYTIFVGASPSVVRAAIMGALAIVAQRLGRRSDGLTALAISVWVMTLFNPTLLFDMGLILSAAATLGLILYSKPLTDFTEKQVSRLFSAETTRQIVSILSEAVLITFAAQITTLPIIFLVFGRFSPLSFITNILVIPVQAPIMSLGILSVIIGAVWLPLGQIVAWLVGIPVAYTLAVIRAMAAVPGASMTVSVEPTAIAAYYLILFGATAVLSQPKENRMSFFAQIQKRLTVPTLSLLGLAIAAILWAVVISRPDGKLHVWFLAVGEGNAVLIQTPNGAHLLVDGGENPTQLRGALGDRLPFYQRDLDVLFVTQPGNKTIAALPPLLDRYIVRTAVTNGQSTDDATFQALTAGIMQQKTNIVPAIAGYSLQTDDGITIEILSPAQAPDAKAKPDDAPLTLKLTYGNASFLLISDLSEKAAKSYLSGQLENHVTVLQLPSNGKEKQNPTDWLDSVAPQVAIIEAEQGNKLAQPADNVLKALSKTNLLRTDVAGTIEVSTDGQSLWVQTGR